MICLNINERNILYAMLTVHPIEGTEIQADNFRQAVDRLHTEDTRLKADLESLKEKLGSLEFDDDAAAALSAAAKDGGLLAPTPYFIGSK